VGSAAAASDQGARSGAGPGAVTTFLLAGLLLAAYAVLAVSVARVLGRTTDEARYLVAADLVPLEGFKHPVTVYHGPLLYHGTQLFQGKDAVYRPKPREELPEVLFRGRLGTLPFGLLCGLLVFLWARRAFGNRGALLALALHALNPIVVGYTGLALVDVYHAACVLFSLYFLARYLEAPRWRWVPCMGLAVGLSLATKYLALLVLLPLPLLLAGRAAWPRAGERERRFSRGVGRALGALSLLALVALPTLYLCYGDGVSMGSSDPAAYRSAALQQLAAQPVLGPLLGLFPAPYLSGVDFQKMVGEKSYNIFLNGTVAHGHWDYYLWVFLCKTPELVLVLALWLLACGLPRLLRRPETPFQRTTAWALLPSLAATLVYMSLFTSLQLGIRYVLALYPMLFVLLGSLAGARWLRALSSARWLGALGLVALVHAWELARNWPNWISYYNASSGGQVLAYRHFRDSNTDFGQYAWGLSELRARAGGELQVVGPRSGARFGPVAVHVANLSRPDPGDPGRPRLDWLEWLEPSDHVGACWLLFEVEPLAFEREVERDPRLREDLALAYLGAGRLQEARAHLGRLAPEDAAPLDALAALLAAPEPDPRATLKAWEALGRYDHVERLLDSAPERLAGLDLPYLRANCLIERKEPLQAIAVLESARSGLSIRATCLLARLLADELRYPEAIALVEGMIAERGGQPSPLLEQTLERIRTDQESLEVLE
jgi:tetratricopeptide (TPR) repeat protein